MSPYRTFDSISKFAELLGTSKSEAFSPRTSTHRISENTEITLIEPPCVSNTMIIKSNEKYLFALERNAVLQRLGVGKWQIFGAHGFKKYYSVSL